MFFWALTLFASGCLIAVLRRILKLSHARRAVWSLSYVCHECKREGHPLPRSMFAICVLNGCEVLSLSFLLVQPKAKATLRRNQYAASAQEAFHIHLTRPSPPLPPSLPSFLFLPHSPLPYPFLSCSFSSVSPPSLSSRTRYSGLWPDFRITNIKLQRAERTGSQGQVGKSQMHGGQRTESHKDTSRHKHQDPQRWTRGPFSE